eukprot:m.49654 g.49654  ORF g.49654 m.49654 type:complete len:62 (+) comp21080_c0_seq1:172-357(+)
MCGSRWNPSVSIIPTPDDCIITTTYTTPDTTPNTTTATGNQPAHLVIQNSEVASDDLVFQN